MESPGWTEESTSRTRKSVKYAINNKYSTRGGMKKSKILMFYQFQISKSVQKAPEGSKGLSYFLCALVTIPLNALSL